MNRLILMLVAATSFLLLGCTAQYIDGVRCDSSISGESFTDYAVHNYSIYGIDGRTWELKECRWGENVQPDHIVRFVDEKGYAEGTPPNSHYNYVDVRGVEEQWEEVFACAKLRYLNYTQEEEANVTEENCLYELALQHWNPYFCYHMDMHPALQSRCFNEFDAETINQYFDEDQKDYVCSDGFYAYKGFTNFHKELPRHKQGLNTVDVINRRNLGIENGTRNAQLSHEYYSIRIPNWCEQYDIIGLGGGGSDDDSVYVKGHYREKKYRPGCATCYSKTWVDSYYRRK